MHRSLAALVAVLSLAAGCSPDARNGAPVAEGDAYSVVAGATLSVPAAGVLANDSDPDGDRLAAAVEAPPAHGTLQLAVDGAFTYAAAPAFAGRDQFTYRASDGAQASAPAVVTVDVARPAISAVDPASGTTGIALSLSGSGFGATAGSVTIGGRSAVVRSWSDAGVAVTVPVDFEPGTHDVVLTTGGGAETAPAGFRIVPSIATVAPTYGEPGALVTARGDALGSAPGTATLGAIGATVESWTNRAVTLRVPEALALGTHDLVLTTAGGAATPARPFAVALEGWATDPTPAARAGHTAVWTGTRMVVWGGRVSYSSLDYYPAAGGRYDPATGAWTRTATGGAAPAARAEHTAVWTGTEMLVFGGTDGAARPDGAAYDPERDAWRTLATADAPGARSLHTAVWTGAEMIVWGGWQGPGTHTATGARYDPAADTWRPISTIGAPTARRAHTAVWTGTEMIVWGGIDAVGTCRDGARYDPATDTWRPVQSTGAPSARNAHTAVWTGTEMIVWGGFSGLQSSAIGSGALYDPATDAWRPVTSTNSPSSRGGHAAIWTGTEMVLWGGWSGGAGLSVGTGSRFDPAANTWTYLSFSAPVARHGHTAIWTGTELIVWGGEGYDRETPFFADGGRWRQEGTADVWTRIPGDGAAPQRTRHAAAWTGRELVIWGGSSADLAPLWKSFIQRGARYDPATATWASVSTVGQPTQRADMPAVWTGSRVIVWGGAVDLSYETTYANTGGMYDPATDTWEATPFAGAPAGRSRHSAVWTGTEMIVWGGSAPVVIGDGARLDPAAGTWRAVSLTGAPAARAQHTAVWTGTEMIVWGGYVGGSRLGTGGRYDPATDSWKPVSTVGAPSARHRHRAVWTGTEMIVWGGDDATLAAADGGRYDPVTDTWRPLATAGAPRGRKDHTAVWTGSELIVWGGLGRQSPNDVLLGDGARYDPQADAWSPVTALDAPAPRAAHSAFWTGAEMLVWGGAPGGADVASYSP